MRGFAAPSPFVYWFRWNAPSRAPPRRILPWLRRATMVSTCCSCCDRSCYRFCLLFCRSPACLAVYRRHTGPAIPVCRTSSAGSACLRFTRTIPALPLTCAYTALPHHLLLRILVRAPLLPAFAPAHFYRAPATAVTALPYLAVCRLPLDSFLPAPTLRQILCTCRWILLPLPLLPAHYMGRAGWVATCSTACCGFQFSACHHCTGSQLDAGLTGCCYREQHSSARTTSTASFHTWFLL